MNFFYKSGGDWKQNKNYFNLLNKVELKLLPKYVKALKSNDHFKKINLSALHGLNLYQMCQSYCFEIGNHEHRPWCPKFATDKWSFFDHF